MRDMLYRAVAKRTHLIAPSIILLLALSGVIWVYTDMNHTIVDVRKTNTDLRATLDFWQEDYSHTKSENRLAKDENEHLTKENAVTFEAEQALLAAYDMMEQLILDDDRVHRTHIQWLVEHGDFGMDSGTFAQFITRQEEWSRHMKKSDATFDEISTTIRDALDQLNAEIPSP